MTVFWSCVCSRYISSSTGKLIVGAGQEIVEKIAETIEESPIETVEIRSVLTCESPKGVCTKCYGRNLASGRMVQKGEAVGGYRCPVHR